MSPNVGVWHNTAVCVIAHSRRIELVVFVVAERMHKSHGSTARQTDVYVIGGVVSDHAL